jgi:hypothetical protein
MSLLFLLGFLVSLTVCAKRIREIRHGETSMMRRETGARKPAIEKIKAKYEKEFLGLEGVEGVGIGEELGKPVIKVYVVRKTRSLQERIPSQIEGYPVRMEVTGEFHAF